MSEDSDLIESTKWATCKKCHNPIYGSEYTFCEMCDKLLCFDCTSSAFNKPYCLDCASKIPNKYYWEE